MSRENTPPHQGSAQIGADEYDYLAKIKSLSEGIEHGCYEKYFGDHFSSRRASAIVRLIVNGKLVVYSTDETHDESVRAKVEREMLQGTLKPSRDAPERPAVIVVEGLDEKTMQMLGTSLDIRPSFFARFLGARDVWRNGCPGLATLDAQFGDYLKQISRPNHADFSKDAPITSTKTASGVGPQSSRKAAAEIAFEKQYQDARDSLNELMQQDLKAMTPDQLISHGKQWEAFERIIKTHEARKQALKISPPEPYNPDAHIGIGIEDRPYMQWVFETAQGFKDIDGTPHLLSRHVEDVDARRVMLVDVLAKHATDRRRIFPKGAYTVQPRMSCCQISAHGWLILVDSCVLFGRGPSASAFPSESYMRTGCSKRNWWRLPSQLSFQGVYRFDLAEILASTFTDDHRGYGDKPSGPATRLPAPTMQLLFGGEDALRTIPPTQFKILLPTLMIMSVYRSNVKYIEDRLDHRRHGAIQDPNLETFQPLALLRQNIADVKDELRKQRDILGAPRLVPFADFDTYKVEVFNWEPPDSVTWDFRTLLEKLEDISKTLDHELELIIGSVTIQDSAISKLQTQRATILTGLAAFYLPLSLVTSIFGMNIQEFSSNPPYWAALIALAAVGATTAVGLGGYALWRYWREKSRMKQAQAERKMYKFA